MVKPEEVMEAPKDGTGIAVCDLPEPSYLSNFLAQSVWADKAVMQKQVGCFFWLLGSGVMADQRLIKFIESFPKSQHVVSSPDVCNDHIVFKGSAKSAALLNHLDKTSFPLLQTAPIASAPVPPNIVPAVPGWKFHIEPKWAADDSRVETPFSVSTAISEYATPAFLSAAAAAKAPLSKFTPASITGADVEIYTLGTGSAAPSKYRNVSSTLVRIPGAGSILLDCGENTLGQLKRLFGVGPELDAVLSDIKLVYISHLHADHHLGTTSVLKARARLLGPDEKTFVIGEKKMLLWLREYADAEHYGYDTVAFIHAESLYHKEPAPTIESEPHLSYLLSSLSLASVTTARADHCLGSHTAAFRFSSGFVLAYSGDTCPTQAFVEIGRGATVLIHEATFEDSMVEEAHVKKHSTIGQALQAGRDMGAWGVILTHFSQRYPKVAFMGDGDAKAEAEAVADAEADGKDNSMLGRVVMAFDCMHVRVGEMGRFALMEEALARVFETDDNEES